MITPSIRRLAAGLVLVLSRVGVTSGQVPTVPPPPRPAVWTLAACIAYARQANIQVNTQRLNQRVSEQELALSRAAVHPNLSATVNQSATQGNILPGATAYQAGMATAGSYGLNSAWTLYRGGVLRQDIAQKRLLVDAAGLTVQQAANDLTLQVTQAYLNILLDQENIRYQREVVGTSRAQVARGQLLLRAGSIARKDMAQLQAQLANDRYTLVTMQSAQSLDQLTLQQLLQLPDSDSAAVAVVPPDTAVAATPVPPLAQVKATAMQQRPEIQNGVLGLQIADLGVRKARAGFRPALTLGVGTASSYASTYPETYGGQLHNNFYQQLSTGLAVPIYSRRVVATQVAEARIALDQAKLNYQNTRLVLVQAVERAFINVQNAQGQYQTATESFRYNRETYRIAQEQLRLGAINLVDFLVQKNLYLQALRAVLQAKYDQMLSTRIYNFYAGQPIS